MQGIPREGKMDGIIQVNWKNGVGSGGLGEDGNMRNQVGLEKHKKKMMTLILCLISLELDLLFSSFLDSRPHWVL